MTKRQDVTVRIPVELVQYAQERRLNLSAVLIAALWAKRRKARNEKA